MNEALPSGNGLRPTGVGGTVGDVLGGYLSAQAGTFLRAVPPGTVDAEALIPALHGLTASLQVFSPLLAPEAADPLRTELAWLRGVLALEYSYTRRLLRLTAALDALAAAPAESDAEDGLPRRGGLLGDHPGVAKARALMERQLSTARARAHTGALQELGSARFHALADRVTLLVSEAPLQVPAGGAADAALLPCLGAAYRALADAVRDLPLSRAAVPYNGDALHSGADDPEEPLWRRARSRARGALRAREVCAPLLDDLGGRPDGGLEELTELLDLARDAVEAAGSAASAARTPRITPATGYVLGVLHADQRSEVEAARYAFSRRWARLAQDYQYYETEASEASWAG